MSQVSVIKEKEATAEAEAAEPLKRGIVIFDTRYGKTEKIARWFESGLYEANIDSFCINVKEVAVESLKEYDLICVGGPTERYSASATIKEFLKKLNGMNFSRKYGFAFDTRLRGWFSGSAAKFIEKSLKSLGLEIIASHQSATVFVVDKAWRDELLKQGEEKRFEQIGEKIGIVLASKPALRK